MRGLDYTLAGSTPGGHAGLFDRRLNVPPYKGPNQIAFACEFGQLYS